MDHLGHILIFLSPLRKQKGEILNSVTDNQAVHKLKQYSD